MRITGPARRGIALLLTGLVAGAALLGAAPAASAAESQAEPHMKCVEAEPYFFHGTSGQQGGFSTDAPTNAALATQLAYQEPQTVREAASWADSFQGDLCEQATVTVYPAQARPSLNGSLGRIWQFVIIADGDDTIASRDTGWIGVTPLQVTVTFRLEAAVAEELEFQAYPTIGSAAGAVLYDSPDYAAGFTVSTLQPCEEHDPHPDCVQAGFADLAGDVRAFAAAGEVTADGETQLLAALQEAETAYGDGDNARAVARLEDFRQLAGDPALVPSEPARDTLTTAASDLIAALESAA